MSQSRPVQRLVLSSVIALGLLISVPVSIAHAYKSVAKPADQQPNYRETILYQNLREQGFKVGYAPYWEAVISTYLADHSVNTVPVTCRTGKLQKYRWLVTDYDLEQTHEKTFLVFDPNFVNTGEMCNEATLTEQFGKPRDVQIIAGWQVNMYDHDILLNN